MFYKAWTFIIAAWGQTVHIVQSESNDSKQIKSKLSFDNDDLQPIFELYVENDKLNLDTNKIQLVEVDKSTAKFLNLNIEKNIHSAMPPFEYWSLIALDTYDVETAELAKVYNYTSTHRCKNRNHSTLGGPSMLNSETTITREFTEIPPHTHVKVELSVNFLGKWKGNQLIVSIDDKPLLVRAHESCKMLPQLCELNRIGMCESDADDTLGQVIRVECAHTTNQLKLTISNDIINSGDAIPSFSINWVAFYITPIRGNLSHDKSANHGSHLGNIADNPPPRM